MVGYDKLIFDSAWIDLFEFVYRYSFYKLLCHLLVFLLVGDNLLRIASLHASITNQILIAKFKFITILSQKIFLELA